MTRVQRIAALDAMARRGSEPDSTVEGERETRVESVLSAMTKNTDGLIRNIKSEQIQKGH